MEISCSSTSLMASWLPTSGRHASLASCRSVFFSNGGRGLPKRRLGLVSKPRRVEPASRGLGCRCLFGLGVPELAVIAGVAALLFGPKKLPEIGKGIGKTVKSFQQAAKEFEMELKAAPEDAGNPPPPAESPVAISGDDEKKELESSSTKEST